MTYDPLLDPLLMEDNALGDKWYLNTILASRSGRNAHTDGDSLTGKHMSSLLNYLPATTVIAPSITGLGPFRRTLIRCRDTFTGRCDYNKWAASVLQAIWSQSIALLQLRCPDEAMGTGRRNR